MTISRGNWLLFFLILFTGVFLRAYDWTGIPFTHDEITAVERTFFPNFQALIEGAVKIDCHPAGVQVFLYFWTSLFGTEPFVVKLPFLLMGLGAIYLTFKVGTYWFNATTGLLASAFLATLQFPVIYSQIARPYSSGLFFTLLAVWHLSKLIWSDNPNWKNWTGWILAAIACSYNHYFSQLAIGIIGVSGLFIIPKERLKHYLVACLGIGLAYLPHLPIFFKQIQGAGLNWLSVPGWIFPLRFIHYTFQYSAWVTALFLGLGVLGGTYHYYLSNDLKVFTNKRHMLLITWFFLPIAIGMGYSWIQDPVTKFSVFLFTYPFFLLLVLSFLPKLTPRVNAFLILLIMVSNIYVLINERYHYEIFYDKNRYDVTFSEAQKDWDQYGGAQKIDYYLSIGGNAYQHWLKKIEIPEKAFNLIDTTNRNQFNNLLAKSDKPYLAIAWPNKMKPDYFGIAQKHYPYLLKRTKFESGSYCLMAKAPHPDTIDPFIATYKQSFEGDRISKESQKKLTNQTAYNGNHAYELKSQEEFGPGIKARLDTILHTNRDVIFTSINMQCEAKKHPLLLLEVKKAGGNNLRWDRNVTVLNLTDNKHWEYAIRAFPLIFKDFQASSTFVKVGIWNKKGANCYIDDLTLKVMEGNPYYYALKSQVGKSID